MRKSNFKVFLFLKVYKLSELKNKYINASVLETAIKDVLDVDIGERGTKKNVCDLCGKASLEALFWF